MREAKGWGGKRKGAGRNKQPGSGLPHRARPLLASRFPVHVTMKVVSDLPNLRAKPQLRVIEGAFRAALGCHGLNLAHYSIQKNHLHLITEAKDRDVLMKGLRGLAIRLARRLNDRLGRHGRVFADRYHQRILKTPSETKQAVAYVLQNRRKHCAERGKWVPRRELDPCSSARYLKDGWKDVAPVPPSGEPTVGEPRTWLLHTGWKLRGKLRTDEVPGR
ncbi:MAG: hypothetical protein IT371_14730 [Deltaproteobacteria bacterium]|nr:hypothetical protein [Deltaproteobacteria bacterium]